MEVLLNSVDSNSVDDKFFRKILTQAKILSLSFAVYKWGLAIKSFPYADFRGIPFVERPYKRQDGPWRASHARGIKACKSKAKRYTRKRAGCSVAPFSFEASNFANIIIT